MSIVRTINLKCDGCTAYMDDRAAMEQIPGLTWTVAEFRKDQAPAFGWLSEKGKDWCPNCLEEN